jgi:hypothetical protein
MLFEWAPLLREMLSADRLLRLSGEEFAAICQRAWSIQDHASRVANATLNLQGGRAYNRATKTQALAQFLFSRRSQNGSNVLQVIHHVLYEGIEENLPNRMWEAITGDQWRIEHLGISALGELVGWALPERFPPWNNRTSKSLRSLGFAVTVHGS